MCRSRLIPLVAVAAAAGLAACSADPEDFSNDAEKLIDEDDDGDLSRQLGVDFDGTECTDPVNTERTTTFTCTATGDDGNTWIFTATIDGDTDYTITDARIADGATPASTPAAPDTVPATVTVPATTAD